MSDPVSIVLRRKVRPGHEKGSDAWRVRLTRRATEPLTGCPRVDLHRPAPPGAAYRCVSRFDRPEHPGAFEGTDLRRQVLADPAPLSGADAAWDRRTGLEFWFEVLVIAAHPGTSPITGCPWAWDGRA